LAQTTPRPMPNPVQKPQPPRRERKPRIVIVGGGFGGVAAARALRKSDEEVVLIDRRNHHIFQPLLYQVATAVLAPSEVAAPIRQLARKQKNLSVMLAEVNRPRPELSNRHHQLRGSRDQARRLRLSDPGAGHAGELFRARRVREARAEPQNHRRRRGHPREKFSPCSSWRSWPMNQTSVPGECVSYWSARDQPAIPRRVAPQQSPLPLRRSPTIVA
jgi:choline dehydrogenase-like flavoprotein